jgi:Leucine-rich repeat (LRR) protein
MNLVGNLPNLLNLTIKRNNVKDLKALGNEELFKNLQTLDLQGNKITELTSIKAPKLMKLNLNENKLDKIESFDGHGKLEQLCLRKNRIAALSGLKDMPGLKELYLVMRYLILES